jgi:hypothetical protein
MESDLRKLLDGQVLTDSAYTHTTTPLLHPPQTPDELQTAIGNHIVTNLPAMTQRILKEHLVFLELLRQRGVALVKKNKILGMFSMFTAMAPSEAKDLIRHFVSSTAILRRNLAQLYQHIQFLKTVPSLSFGNAMGGAMLLTSLEGETALMIGACMQQQPQGAVAEYVEGILNDPAFPEYLRALGNDRHSTLCAIVLRRVNDHITDLVTSLSNLERDLQVTSPPSNQHADMLDGVASKSSQMIEAGSIEQGVDILLMAPITNLYEDLVHGLFV